MTTRRLRAVGRERHVNLHVVVDEAELASRTVAFVMYVDAENAPIPGHDEELSLVRGDVRDAVELEVLLPLGTEQAAIPAEGAELGAISL